MFNKTLLSTTITCLLGLTAFDALAGNHAAKQMGARNRVWTQGVTGDPNSTVAIFDTGIDVNHQALGPYNGNGDWSGKTVFWYHSGGNDAGDDHTSFGPGHGTHAAGIIAGAGFGAVDSEGRIVNTNAYTSGLNGEYPEQTAIRVDKVGTIRIEYTFNSDKGDVTYLELRKGNKEQVYDMSDGRKVLGDTVTVARLDNPTGTPELHKKDTPEELGDINWNVLEFEVTNPSQFGTYHVVTNRVIPSGGMFGAKMHFVYVARWPAQINPDGTDPSDGLPYYMGMAPDTKLFGVKATSASEFKSNINALWSELSTYHTVVVNLSAGGSSLSDSGSIWSKLEGMGIIGVSAAGNETGTAGLVAPANLPGTVAVGGVTA
ncbi:MAG: S8 family serine peptidase, partial [Algicola sp.]|nr:S8 family serine peptidase [Algicola sp.]